MDLGLSGKVAVVTGAGRGIGLAVSTALAREGASVVAGSRTISKELEALAGEYPVHPVAVDLSGPQAPAELVAEAVAAFGGIDVVVNNVGAVRPRVDGFLAVTDADWEAAWQTNLMVAVRTCRAALPHLLEHESSAVVTVSSVNASLPDPLVVDYSAAKAALTNCGKSLSKEFGPRGVRVTTVSPGPVATDLWLGGGGVAEVVGGAVGADPEAVADQAVAGTATRRFTRPEEVADLVALLAGGTLPNLTGTEVIIDGGLTQSL
ncbi:SDR family oxidoreductase [Actinomycetospora sp. TBRC 11914]|uniref:SDR family NAD(P)-dependent oxidoreductase n=1 Tax=Actinomycetospora sp. TBRC 11914 TaxID=2729387 RepID=UPI00145F561C|nr:SDR family oxidoreductase [Actinomycetospora sp. TBRC 11914]NMO89502.1 SDR family oxidoreductase [Actinomycetospora sp. TBRC 11914]